ncbi:hypothetical protein JCM10212_003680 [Sporobolomyces blumeae]
MHRVLRRSPCRAPQLSRALVSPTRSFSLSTSTAAVSSPPARLSLGERLRQRRSNGDGASSSSFDPVSSASPRPRDRPPHLDPSTASSIPLVQQITIPNMRSSPAEDNLPGALGRLTQRAIDADPVEHANKRRERLEAQKRREQAMQEKRDRSKRAIAVKRQAAREADQATRNGDEQPRQIQTDPLVADLRRRIGYKNPGKNKRDAKTALRIARLAAGGSLTSGEQTRLAHLEKELSLLKNKRRRMVPWDQLSQRSKSTEIYKIERRIERDEKREEAKAEILAAAAENPVPASTPPATASFEESLSAVAPRPPPDDAGAPSNETTSRSAADGKKLARLKQEILAETARKAWTLRRTTIVGTPSRPRLRPAGSHTFRIPRQDDDIAAIERSIANYTVPYTPTPGPAIPVPKKRDAPPLIHQLVNTLQVSGPRTSGSSSSPPASPTGNFKNPAVRSGSDSKPEPSVEEAARMLMTAVEESTEDGTKRSDQGPQEAEGRKRDPRKRREERKAAAPRERSAPYGNHPALREPSADEPAGQSRDLSSYPFQLSPTSTSFAPTPSPYSDVKIAELSHGLSRVLFNPGVHFLRDPRSGVYNFPPDTLEHVPKLAEFEFDKLPQYVTSSKDETLKEVARREKKRFVGSTSSTVGMLCQIYFWLSKGKEVNLEMLSESWQDQSRNFTMGQQMPVSVILNHEEDGTYSIDADKSFDATSESNVLADYGHLMEKLLTTDSKEFKRFLVDSDDPAPSEASHRQAYHYATTDDMVLRSQLDAHHGYLPGNGTFDLKTRGTVAIRQDRLNYEESAGYKIDRLRGPWESFEREYYDLIRSAFLKYQFQARIGCMDGILVAYHSTARFYGFQYLPISEMDEALFDTHESGDQVFRLCVGMLERLLQRAAACYPGESVSVTFSADKGDALRLFVSPRRQGATPELRSTPEQQNEPSRDKREETPTGPVPMTLLEVRGTNYLDGSPCLEPVVIRPRREDSNDVPVWQVGYEIDEHSTGDERGPATTTGTASATVSAAEIAEMFNEVRETQQMFSSLMLPTGVSVKAIKAAAEQARKAGIELDPSDLSVRFPLDEGITYRGPSQQAKELRQMARRGEARTRAEEERREGSKVVVVKSTLEVREP